MKCFYGHTVCQLRAVGIAYAQIVIWEEENHV